jgi:copper homeostasis protein
LVKTLVEQANNRIIIMPGSGLNSSNVKEIIDTAGVTEVHTSARIRVPSNTAFRNPLMPEDFDIDFVDANEIKKIKSIINQ